MQWTLIQHRLRSKHGLLRNKQAYTISPGLKIISEKTEVNAVDRDQRVEER